MSDAPSERQQYRCDRDAGAVSRRNTALAAEYSDIPLVAVDENKTILGITNRKMRMANVIEVGSYLEAAGVILALRRRNFLGKLAAPDRHRRARRRKRRRSRTLIAR